MMVLHGVELGLLVRIFLMCVFICAMVSKS
jgi:hypothetical protein